MSTYINVTVGKAGLSDQAKQQTNANRQAKLEADARDKAEVDGKRQRDANRALQGIGPDGKPLYGQALVSKRPWEEPAAYRNHVILDYFWFDDYYDSTAIGLGIRHFKFAPAAGSPVSEFSYTNKALLTTLRENRTAHVAPTTHVPNGPGLVLHEEFDNGTLRVWKYRDISCTAVDTVELSNPKYPFFTQPPTLFVNVYENEQVQVTQNVSVTTYERLLFLPLGGRQMLFIAYRHEVGAEINTTVRERRRQTPYQLRVGTVNELLTDYRFSSQEGVGTSTTVNKTEQEDCICVLVNGTLQQQITPPALLLARLREKRGTVADQMQQASYQRIYGNSNATIGGVCFEQGTYDPGFNLFDTFSNTISYQYTAPVRSDSQLMNLVGYGLFYQGHIQLSVGAYHATPIAWYDLNRTTSNTLSTHEGFRDLTAPGILQSVGEALKTTNCLGQPSLYFENTVIGASTEPIRLRRSSKVMEGSIFSQNYLYTSADDWTAPNVSISKGMTGEYPFDNATPYLIYDWGNPALCRQQATAYKIFNEIP